MIKSKKQNRIRKTKKNNSSKKSLRNKVSKRGGWLFGKSKSVELSIPEGVPNQPVNRLNRVGFLYQPNKRVLFEDGDVCILNPELKEGILVWTHYTQPKEMNSLCNTGLKSGKKLHNNGINFGREIYHPYIFFRAPYFANEINYESIETEIESSYGDLDEETRVFIRVDPDKTYVYSSEIRVKFIPQIRFGTDKYVYNIEKEVMKSKKTLRNYLQIIKENENVKGETNQIPIYNLFSSKKIMIDKDKKWGEYPWNLKPIEENSEILVRMDHLTPDYFVKCTH